MKNETQVIIILLLLVLTIAFFDIFVYDFSGIRYVAEQRDKCVQSCSLMNKEVGGIVCVC